MVAQNVLKNINAFVNGFGYAGQVSDYNPPDLTIATQDFRAGGMDAAVKLDMGMEPLETSFNLLTYAPDALVSFGVAEGNTIPLILRGALESWDGTITAVVLTMQGKLTKISRGTWKPGDVAQLNITASLHYYKEVVGTVTAYEIDIPNMKRIVNGVDRLAQIRNALGM